MAEAGEACKVSRLLFSKSSRPETGRQSQREGVGSLEKQEGERCFLQHTKKVVPGKGRVEQSQRGCSIQILALLPGNHLILDWLLKLL